MSNFEKKYKKLLLQCLSNNSLTNNRTNTKTYKLFNKFINIDLTKGFPILTSKKIFFDKALAEFKWMYKGRTDLKYLQDNNIKWWNDFANDNKELGKVYGHQIRNFGYEIDQIKYAIQEINNNTRRAIITLWNPCDLNDQALPCCFTQFNFVRINNKLNMTMAFRSSDLFLGLPYDIIVGALFLITISNKCNLQPHTLGINIADAHIYENHLNQVKKYCNNKMHPLPILFGDYNNYNIKNYISESFIKAKLVK